jgi:hypothetical protein
MELSEALAHVEDATPGEDVEAWIAKMLAAEVRELRQIRGQARRMITVRDEKIEELTAENAALRARVAELELIEQRAREVRGRAVALGRDGGPEALYILGEL